MPPAAPVISSVAPQNESQIDLGWNPAYGATGYKVELRANNTTVQGYPKSVASSVTGYSFTGLNPNTQYTMLVVAANAGGEGPPSATVNGTTAPAVPATTGASGNTDTSFTANWSSVSGALGYYLDVSTAQDAASVLPSYANLKITSTSKLVAGLGASTTYYYRVRSYNSSAVSTSSSWRSAATAPSQPGQPSIPVVSDNSVKIQWPSVGGATGYRVDVSTDSNFAANKTAPTDAGSATSYDFTSLGRYLRYYFRIVARNGSVDSTPSAGVSFDVPSAKATGLTASSDDPTAIQLGWTKPATANSGSISRYDLFRSTSSTFSGAAFLASASNEGFSDSTALPEITYYYWVRAVNNLDASSALNQTGGTPGARPKATPVMTLNGNLSFGDSPVGNAKSATLAVKNTGFATLNIGSITFPAGFRGDWNSGALAPNVSSNLVVTFFPGSPGTYSGNITFSSDAASGQSAIAASGVGVSPGTLQFVSTNFSVGESNCLVTLTVTRTSGVLGAVSVAFATTNGTAIAGADYVSTNGILTWADGDTGSKTLSVAILDDTETEGDESFTVQLANPGGGALLGTNIIATITILANDPPTAPSIIGLIPATATVLVGDSTNFTVNALGIPVPGFQWQFNGTRLPNQTNAILNLSNVVTNQTGNYTVVASNSLGMTTSAPVSLMVNRRVQSISGFPALVTKLLSEGVYLLPDKSSANLPLTYASSDSSVASVSGNVVTLVAVGSATLTATQAGDATYLPVTSDQRLGIVAAGPLYVQGAGVGYRLGFGDSDNANHYSPTPLMADANWTMVVAAGAHSVALRADGTLWHWGTLTVGGSSGATKVPVQIGTSTDWKFIGGGLNHTLGIKQDGTLWAWNGSDPARIGTDNDWNYATGGNQHSVALKQDGSLWSFGDLGPNGAPPSGSRFGTASWKDVAAGNDNNLGIQADGSLWQWTRNDSAPTRVAGVESERDWASVAVDTHFLAIKTDGRLYAWGANNAGQLGVGTTTAAAIPTQVGSATDWQAVVAGSEASAAQKRDGTWWGWGNNYYGWIGDGTSLANVLAPTRLGGPFVWTAVSVSGTHTLAVKYVPPPVVAPTIIAQPASITVSVASKATFRVTASGTPPLAYQWRFNGTNIPAEIGDTLSFSSVLTNKAGSYDVIVSNNAGSVTSAPPAVLAVNRLMQTVSFPALTNKQVGDASFTLNATASSGLPVSFSSSDPSVAAVTGVNVTIGAAGTALIIASQEGDANYAPAMNVTNLLTVAQLYTLSVTAANGSVSRSPNQAGYSPNATVTLTAAPNPGYLFTGWSGDASGMANPLDITMNGNKSITANFSMIPLPVIISQPTGQSITNGTGIVLSVGATGTGLTYQWKFNGTNIPNANAPTLTLTNLSAAAAGRYTVEVSNAGGTVASIPADLTYFGDPQFMLVTVLAGPIGSRYRIEYTESLNGTPVWATLGEVVLTTSPQRVIDENSPGRPRRYYRVAPVP